MNVLLNKSRTLPSLVSLIWTHVYLNELELYLNLPYKQRFCQLCSTGPLGEGGKEAHEWGLETSSNFSFSVVYFSVLHKILSRAKWGVFCFVKVRIYC